MYYNSRSTSTGHKANLTSGKIYANTTKCLHFHYHMYGRTMGSLAVYLIKYNTITLNGTRNGITVNGTRNGTTVNGTLNGTQSTTKKLWSISGNKGNVWIEKEITLNFDKGYFYQV